MNNFSLLSISPIDGRYYNKTISLKKIFSEYAFLRYRLIIEIKWLKKLSSVPEITELECFDQKTNLFFNNIIHNFNLQDAKKIKIIESIVNHDIKSIEYFLRKKIFNKLSNYKSIVSFIHFACTSDDINNLAYGCMIKKTISTIIIPYWKNILSCIKNMAHKYKDISILSRTHGQPATPSTLGKEMINFYYRLNRQLLQLKNIQILGKINGATGNYNAHLSAYPEINWYKISQDFVSDLGLTWNPCTTQIEPHDYISELFSCIVRFNLILINFNQDLWAYISLNYFNQVSVSSEVGSSTMPHKINPIQFEQSEGNLGLSNAMMNHMIIKLPISRWQRDLTDSTVLRNVGVAISYSIISYESLLSGLNKINVNIKKIECDLKNQWQLLSEPIQTVMRRFKILHSYEELKKLTRNKKVSMQDIHNYIDKLKIPNKEKDRLKNLCPMNYIGYSSDIVKKICNNIFN